MSGRPIHGSPFDPEGVITDPHPPGKKLWRPESQIPDHADVERKDEIPKERVKPRVVREDEMDYDLE